MVKLQLRLEAARSSHSSRQGNSKSYYCSVQGLGGGVRYIVVVKLQLRLEAARSSHSSRQENSKSYYCSVQGLGG